MNQGTSHGYNPPPKTPEATVANEKPNAIADPVAETKEPLQPTQSSYRAISTGRSGIRLGSIIIVNCFCSGFICLCLWYFSKIDDLTRWEKRAFNTLSLLLSAALASGIGFLCDQIGLLARGTVLQSKPHSLKGVCASISVVNVLMIYLHFCAGTY